MEAFCGRAQAWDHLHNYEQALSDSLKALQLDEDHVRSKVHKGKALIGLGRYDEAISWLEALTSEGGEGEDEEEEKG